MADAAEKTDTASKGELAVAEDPNTALTISDDFFEGAGEGMEDFAQGDFLVPYIRIIQALSKELQKGHAKYIQGAENGMFVNSATKRLWKGEEGFYAVPIHFQRRYQAWKPNNGGPADDYGENSAIYDSLTPNDQGKRIDANGNEVTAAAQYFILIVDITNGDHEIAVLSFGGVQQKKSRQWNSLMASRRETRPDGKRIQPANWFYTYHITSVPESNDKGQWYGFLIEEGPKVPELPRGTEIFQFAKATRDQIIGGQIKTAVDEPDHVGDSDVSPEDEKAF